MHTSLASGAAELHGTEGAPHLGQPWPVPGLGVGLVLAFGVGLGIAAWTQAVPAPTTDALAVWVADRDGGQVLGLDAQLFPEVWIQAEQPVLLAPRADRGAWLVEAQGAGDLGRHRLSRLEADGTRAAQVEVGVPLCLASMDGGDALLVELGLAPSSNRVLRFDDTGQCVEQLELPDALSVAGAHGEVLVGTQSGELVRLGAGGILDRLAVGGEPGALAVGPRPETWWTLDLVPPHRLALRGRNLELLWEVDAGLAALSLAPVPGQEQVWLADANEPWARRFGPQGQLELELAELPLALTGAALADLQGGVLLATPGALLRFDALGQSLPGQGGFDYLSALAPVGG